MLSALYVTTKSFYKRARIGALIAVSCLVMGPLLYRAICRLQGLKADYVGPDLFAFHFPYLGLSWTLFLGVCIYGLQGTRKILCGLPVSSTSIATWLMFAMAGLVVLLQLVTNGFYRVLFFDQSWLTDYWPLAGPLLFLVTLVLVSHCLFWSLYATSFTRLVLSSGLIVVLFWWFISRYYPNGYAADMVPWSQMTISEFITLQVVCLAAWYQGTRAFGKVRSGTAVTSPQWEQLRHGWNALMTGAISDRKMIPVSRCTSLKRLHWNDSCLRAVIIVGVLLALVVLVINLYSVNHLGSTTYKHMVRDFSISTTIFSFASAVLVGVMLGEGVNASGRTEIKRFLAMAPLSDYEFSKTLFLNMVKSSVLTFLLIQMGLVLSFVGAPLLSDSEQFKTGPILGPFLLSYSSQTSFLVFGFWILIANSVSILWTGRTWFYYTVIGIFFGGLISLFLFIGFLHWINVSSDLMQNYITPLISLTIFLLIVGGTVAAFLVARRRKLIKPVTVPVALVSWLISSAGYAIWFLFLRTSRFYVDWTQLLFVSSMFALFILPFATIPLALAWNRHR